MPSSTLRLFLLVASLAATVNGQPRRITLRASEAAASPPQEFSRIAALLELDANHLLVSDDKENRIVALDLRTGKDTPVGRVGGGPSEFRVAGNLFPRPGGAYLADFAQRRLLVLNADLSFSAPIAYPSSIMLVAADPSGALYGDAFFPRLGSAAADSLYLVRWVPTTKQVDTIMAWNAQVSKSSGPRGRPREALPALPAWEISASGDIVILDAQPYRATTYRNGKAYANSTFPGGTIPFTAADREAFLRAFAEQPVMQMGQGAGSGGKPPMPEFIFPASYPAFGGEGLGGRYTLRAPAGHIWLRRLRSAADTDALYDVLDPQATRVIASVILPPKMRVAGIGRSALYLVHTDDDGIQRIRRFAYPTLIDR